MKLLRDYQDRVVRLTDERLAHIREHPEMSDMEVAISDTLARPQLVIQSVSDPEATQSYRYYFGTKAGDKWLCVVAKYSEVDAFVLTAYLTNEPKKGTRLWPTK